jgi:hypothetical protein
MASHAIFTIEKKSESVVLASVQHTADMDNGSVVHAGDFVSGSGEVRQVVVPTAQSILTDEVLLVHSPEIQGNMYLPYSTLQDFYNPANKPARAYYPHVGMQFTISTDGFDGTAAQGKYLIPQAGSIRLTVANDLSGGTRFAAKILDTTGQFGYTGNGYQKKNVVLCEVVKC